MTVARSRIVRPRSATKALTAAQVAKAYNYPTAVTGKGRTAAVIELGGGFDPAQFPNVTAVSVAGAENAPDGPNGADSEVQLDLEVISQVAPGAKIRCYFAPNTDAGFLQAVNQAATDLSAGDAISISWGGPENAWYNATMDAFDAAFKAARARGINVFAAAGDSGSDDGTRSPEVDFPASSPNVVGCGGTRLTVDSSGARSTETVWNDSANSSATGGGVSQHFPGRCVPDVAGDADPVTGYEVTIDGGQYVIGGTSAVAPLYAALSLLLAEASGASFDLLSMVPANPQVCFDVTSGNNGAFRAGPGRDQTTGFGVVDGSKLLAVLQATAPPAPTPTPTPTPIPAPTPVPDADAALLAAGNAWEPGIISRLTKAGHLKTAFDNWKTAHGYGGTS